MNCWLCGHETGGHHMGCMRAAWPALTVDMAVEMGLMEMPKGAEVPAEPKVEVLKEGTMQTVPETREPDGGTDVSVCEFGDCDNPKYSDSPRAKYCEEHKDPKNRKE